MEFSNRSTRDRRSEELEPRPRPERKALEAAMSGWSRSSPHAHGDGLLRGVDASPMPANASAGCPTTPPESRAAFQPWLDKAEASEDPLFFAVIDKASGKVAGRQTLMRIDPANGVDRDRQHLLGAADVAQAGRDRGAVPVHAIRLRRSRLPPLRVEVQQPQRAVEARGASASASRSRACSASTWSSRARTATRPGIRSSTRNGRR